MFRRSKKEDNNNNSVEEDEMQCDNIQINDGDLTAEESLRQMTLGDEDTTKDENEYPESPCTPNTEKKRGIRPNLSGHISWLLLSILGLQIAKHSGALIAKMR
jgi:hypothetical protein